MTRRSRAADAADGASWRLPGSFWGRNTRQGGWIAETRKPCRWQCQRYGSNLKKTVYFCVPDELLSGVVVVLLLLPLELSDGEVELLPLELSDGMVLLLVPPDGEVELLLVPPDGEVELLLELPLELSDGMVLLPLLPPVLPGGVEVLPLVPPVPPGGVVVLLASLGGVVVPAAPPALLSVLPPAAPVPAGGVVPPVLGVAPGLSVLLLLLVLPAVPVVPAVLPVAPELLVLPAPASVASGSFFSHAPKARVATKAASNTECFI